MDNVRGAPGSDGGRLPGLSQAEIERSLWCYWVSGGEEMLIPVLGEHGWRHPLGCVCGG